MALRTFAREATSRLGLRAQPSLCSDLSLQFLRTAGARTYATVLDGLKYCADHEWAKVEGDVATIGITDFAQAELGDIVYVELPEVGTEVTKDATFGVVESVKAASDINSPLSGEVTEINSSLVDEPAKVNSEPFESGWMIKIKLSDSSQVDSLMDKSAYEKHCEDSAH